VSKSLKERPNLETWFRRKEDTQKIGGEQEEEIKDQAARTAFKTKHVPGVRTATRAGKEGTVGRAVKLESARTKGRRGSATILSQGKSKRKSRRSYYTISHDEKGNLPSALGGTKTGEKREHLKKGGRQKDDWKNTSTKEIEWGGRGDVQEKGLIPERIT